jgi:septal ring factor EnvC (AmiA/AmiB activator)
VQGEIEMLKCRAIPQIECEKERKHKRYHPDWRKDNGGYQGCFECMADNLKTTRKEISTLKDKVRRRNMQIKELKLQLEQSDKMIDKLQNICEKKNIQLNNR